MYPTSRNKIIIITVLTVIILVIASVALILSDAFSGKLTYTFDRFFNQDNSDNSKVDPSIGYNETILNASLPSEMFGVWMDLSTDLSISPESSYGELVAEANEDFSVFKNVLAQTLFIKPDTAGKYAGLHDAYGNHVYVLREITAHAQDNQYFTVLVADADLIFDDQKNLTFEAVQNYLQKYNLNAVLLAADFSDDYNKMSQAVSYFEQQIKNSFENVFFGLKVNGFSDTCAAYLKNMLENGELNYLLVDADASLNSNPSYKNIISSWNAFASGFPQTRFYSLHRNDLVCTNHSDWNSNLEIANQIRVLWDCENISGSVFFNATALKNNVRNSVLRLSALLYDGDESMSKLKITSLQINAENGTVQLIGSPPVGHQLRVNGTVATNDGGSFNYTYKMCNGGNLFHFYSCGESLKYRIYNNTSAVSPPEWYTDKASPFTDNGLGTSLMCRIINDNTESLGALNEKNTYHADYSALSEGMLDYVNNIIVSNEGYLRYELQSGVTVYGVNCELINNAYVLPQNKLTALYADDSKANSTDIYFDTDWFVPVTVQCKPQVYYSGYEKYSFNISSFSAEYLEVKFAHTQTFYNLSDLHFSENSVFSRTELYTDNNGSMLLRLYLRQKGQFYGFHIKHENGQIILSCKKHADGSLAGKIIMLDPGHGGYSMTGTAFNNTIAEKDVTLSIALKAKQMLEAYGATVILTRYSDLPLTLSERCDLIDELDPDIFVSIHCDGSDKGTDAGTHTFYFRPYSMPLAKAIHESMVSIYRSYIYAPTDTNYPLIDKSIKYYPFFVTRMNHCPAVLCETGFMSNPIEGMILTNDNNQYWMAQGIADGIRNYFSNNY